MIRETFESALDAGILQTRVLFRDGERWYTCRRNGKTKTWKKDPSRFEIPIKFRLRDTMMVKSDHFYSGEVDKWFRVTPIEGVEVVEIGNPAALHTALARSLGE